MVSMYIRGITNTLSELNPLPNEPWKLLISESPDKIICLRFSDGIAPVSLLQVEKDVLKKYQWLISVLSDPVSAKPLSFQLVGIKVDKFIKAKKELHFCNF